MSITRDIFKLGFQCSPIILTGGIAQGIPGNMLPIVTITEAASFLLGILNGSVDVDLDQYFAQFRPIPGNTLIANQLGQYPFANQTVAANAIITQPLAVSLNMYCPVRTPGGYFSKLLTMTALKQILDKHIQQGGTFTVATPSYMYTNCLLLNLRDVSAGQSKQAQTAWQWDFTQPLITQDDAQGVYNSLMAKLAGGLPTGDAPTWSGVATSVGSSISGAATALLSSAQNLIGSTVSSAQGVAQAFGVAAPASTLPGVG